MVNGKWGHWEAFRSTGGPGRLAYNAGLAALLPAAGACYAYRTWVRKKVGARWADRFGLLPEELQAARLRLPNERVIWFHAVSVGEVVAAQPILREVASRNLPLRVYLSVTTPTGFEMAQSRISTAAGIFYLPFDFPACVRQALTSLMPDLLVLIETELWPNLLAEARALDVRTILVNGRISDRSFARARRFRLLFRWMLGNLDAICLQSELDRARVEALGAPPERVRVMGNSKFDEPLPAMTSEDCANLRRLLGFSAEDRVLVFGSTGPGEEPILLDAYATVRMDHPDVRLVLVPRHPERAPEVAEFISERGFDYCLRSQLEDVAPAALGEAERPRLERVVLVDTIGELGRLYAIADIAFLGRSLVPMGGGNILQPLAFGKPVLFGPHMENFKETTQMALEAGIGYCVAGGSELASEILRLLSNPLLRSKIGEDAKRTLSQNYGASQRYADAIVAALGMTNDR